MDAHRTPDELAAQNELICVKLLGWKLAGRGMFGAKMWLDHPNGDDGEQWHTVPMPSFDTWADAGLILEALRSNEPTVEYIEGKWDCYGGDPYKSFFHAYAETGPLAVRAAAIEYIRSLP